MVGFKLINYLQTRIVKGILKSQLWRNVFWRLRFSDLILSLIYQYAWSVAKRQITYLRSLCETAKNDDKPITTTTVITFMDNGLALKISGVSIKKSNVEGTTSINKIKLVESIQNCLDARSKMFMNLFRLTFAQETLLIA
jgi:hypothetical protein